METKKKMSIGLAMAAIMVAAVFAPMAFAAPPAPIPYEVVVQAGQSTFICCGPDGDFGTTLPGGAPIDIFGTFGLKNEGNTAANVEAAFTTSKAPGQFGLVNPGTTEVILAHNFMLRKNGKESNMVLYECCTEVLGGDGDEGWPLTPDPKLAFIDNVVVNGVFDCGEPLYNDKDGDNFVSDLDHRKTSWDCGGTWLECCTLVDSMTPDPDVGLPLLPLPGAGFVDFDGSGTFDCGEPIYNDVEPFGVVSLGDHRKTDVYAQVHYKDTCVCEESACCDIEEAYTALSNDGVDVLLPGTIPGYLACCCCYDAQLTVPGLTAPDNYAGNVQLTFSNAP